MIKKEITHYIYGIKEGEFMDKEVIKKALSYDLGSNLHEEWRKTRLNEDGTYEPRIKKSKDEAWNEDHGTDEVDIANCTFAELPSNWQYENLEAAKTAINLVFDKTFDGETISDDELENLASEVHDAWLSRNEWVFDKEYGDPKLSVPYSELSKEEQDKDKVQLQQAIYKIQDFKDGLVDVDEICQEYGIKKDSGLTK